MWELGRLKIKSNIDTKNTNFNCYSVENAYTKCPVKLRLKGIPGMDSIERLEGTDISVNLSDGSCLLKGICVGADLISQSQYSEVVLHISSYTYHMDNDKNKRSFQNPEKTLSSILNTIGKTYKGNIHVDNDKKISEIITQNNETDWSFIKREVFCCGESVYDNNKRSRVDLFIGNSGMHLMNGDENS